MLIAVFVLSVGIMSVLLFFSNAMLSTEFAGDMTTATSHAEYLLEEMQSRQTLANIVATDWAGWAQKQGLKVLPEETYNIRFTNTENNPLDIQTTVTWKKNSRINQVTLITSITK